jgi:hypothetical protein
MSNENHIKRYIQLFRGNNRSYGEWDPGKSSQSMRTVKDAVTARQYELHLAGKMGLGMVPIRDDGLCWFGAIDVDNHGKSEDLDLPHIESKVRSAELPLVVCRSKSGGAHLYLFGREPLRADMVKTILTKWMSELKFEGSDCVFPKQVKLALDSKGQRPLGNWINLPYFGGDDTERYALDNGNRCSLDLFLDNAENGSITQEQLEDYFGSEHSDAPPCIRKALKEGIPEGSRNEALFHLTIYNKKRHPEGAREMSHAMQADVFSSPLSFPEADAVIKSALKKSYGYSCKKEPWASWCDRDACRKCKFGISENDYTALANEAKLPMFSDLVKYLNTEPVMWELKMNGASVTMTTEELIDYRAVRIKAMEKISVVLPSTIKASQWSDEILAELMRNARVEEAPLESSPLGALAIRLDEFLRKADLSSTGEDAADKEGLMRGMPVVQMFQGNKVIMFRSIDYEDFLKRTKTDIPRNKTLWHRANRDLGVSFARVRVKNHVIQVWVVPFEKVVDVQFDSVDHELEY